MSSNSSIDERISSNVRSLKSYSVPQIKCSIKLDGNESPYDLYPDLKDIILKDLEELQLNRYPDPDFLSIKSKLANLHSITEEGILLGNGSDEIIQMLITVFSGKSGKILVPSPTFSMYKLTGIALNKEVLETDLDEDFDLDLNEILKTIDNEDPDLIFFATPNNPTGNSFSKKKILEILENTNAIVIIDEAYFDYSKDTFLPYMEKYDQLMILRTMSKIGLASLRLGFLFGQPDLIKELNKARLPYNINSFSQSLMNIVLDNLELIENNVEEIIAEREKLKNKLSKISGFKVYPSDANFFFIKTQDADFLFNELVKKDILIRNFNKPGRLENCVRITIGTPSENEYLIQALKGIFSD